MQDNFTRADSTASIGSATPTGIWFSPSDAATLGISTGRGTAISGTGRALIDTGISDKCAIQGQLTTLANARMSLAFRSHSVNPQWLEVANVGISYVLSKFKDAIESRLVTYSTTPVSGDTIRVELNGPQISVYLNGAIIIQREESTYEGSASHGFRVSSTEQRFDDFKFEVRL